MNIAVVGCTHGQLDVIYSSLAMMEKQRRVKVDLVLCCGDFQACRNEADLCTMSCPPKYLRMGDFHRYYSGEKKAPVLTLVVGGNHEASNHFAELHHGGWLAPNIYYVGYSNVVRFGGLRIAGWSGIYEQRDFNRPHDEIPPFNVTHKVRSMYHLRSVDNAKFAMLPQPDLDIVVTHDWPTDIVAFGDSKYIRKYKSFLLDNIEHGQLGNPHTNAWFFRHHPLFWFAAHLHLKFPALVPHCSKHYAQVASQGKVGYRKGSAPISCECSQCNVGSESKSSKELRTSRPEWCRFLALDKPLRNRRWMQVFSVPDECIVGPKTLQYDLPWLAVVRKCAQIVRNKKKRQSQSRVLLETRDLKEQTVTKDDIQATADCVLKCFQRTDEGGEEKATDEGGEDGEEKATDEGGEEKAREQQLERALEVPVDAFSVDSAVYPDLPDGFEAVTNSSSSRNPEAPRIVKGYGGFLQSSQTKRFFDMLGCDDPGSDLYSNNLQKTTVSRNNSSPGGTQSLQPSTEGVLGSVGDTNDEEIALADSSSEDD